MNKHIHHNCIVAFACGKRIEVLAGGSWRYCQYPTWHPDKQYRIEADPVPCTHKWYKEMIAWANGEVIEYYDKGKWIIATTPTWEDSVVQFRIQPTQQKVTGVYRIYLWNDNGQYRIGVADNVDHSMDSMYTVTHGFVKWLTEEIEFSEMVEL
jgi:hypothetical protein